MTSNNIINPLDEGINNLDNDYLEINKIIEDNKPKQTRKHVIKEIKKCTLCNETKKVEEFIVNHIVDNRTYYKNKCIKCYNKKGKEYYAENKEKCKKRYEISKPKFSIKIKYNNLEELNQHYERLKNELLNN